VTLAEVDLQAGHLLQLARVLAAGAPVVAGQLWLQEVLRKE
jgi:hypothetical protein